MWVVLEKGCHVPRLRPVLRARLLRWTEVQLPMLKHGAPSNDSVRGNLERSREPGRIGQLRRALVQGEAIRRDGIELGARCTTRVGTPKAGVAGAASRRPYEEKATAAEKTRAIVSHGTPRGDSTTKSEAARKSPPFPQTGEDRALTANPRRRLGHPPGAPAH